MKAMQLAEVSGQLLDPTDLYGYTRDTSRVRDSTNQLSVASVRERTIPTERPPLVGEDSANFCG
jgi:hypothetical protein